MTSGKRGAGRGRQRLEFEAQLKGDHAGSAIAAEAYAEEARWWRSGVGEGAKAGLSGGLAGDTGEDHAGQGEVWMVEHIEELDVEAQLHALGESEPLCEVEIAPREFWAAQRVAAESAELAVRGAVASSACAGAGIDGGNERVGIEPLHGARLSDARNRTMLVEWHAGNDTRELRAAAVDDAIAGGGIWRAEDRKRNAAVPEDGTGDLPAVESVAEKPVFNFRGKLIGVLRVEIVADVVIAGAVVAR